MNNDEAMTEKMKAEQLAQALNKEMGMEAPKLSPKQAEKKRKQEENYWNGMISRKEAFQLVKGATAQQDEKLRTLYIVTNTLLALVKDLGLADQSKLDDLSRRFVEQMYGPASEEDGTTE
ncbi:hypothetical protein D1872_52090 [compost metagenome]